MYQLMMQGMVDGTLKALEQPETAERMAKFVRRYYDALVRQGSSKDEALRIVAAVGVPSPMTK